MTSRWCGAIVAIAAIVVSTASMPDVQAATFQLRVDDVVVNFPAGSQGYVSWGGDCCVTADLSGGFQLQAQMVEMGNSQVAVMRVRWGLAVPVELAGPGT